MMADPDAPDEPPLAGELVLVVEDEMLVLLELESIVSEAGANVESCRTVRSALDRIDAVDVTAAVLDVRLGAESVSPVARRLAERRIPFLFYTGQPATDPVLIEWSDCKVLGKPVQPAAIVDTLAGIVRAAQ
jgi:DNA-binding NtrC family response regulator